MSAPSPWWHPEVHADRRPFLLARARILVALRRWFEARGFVEVETPVLQISPGNETHLHAFATELVTPAGTRQQLYLHTSPEFACKKLLAAGERRIFTFARVFRNRERGPLHHPEFTLLEWYRAEEPYEALMEDCAAIIAETARTVGSRDLRWRDRTANPFSGLQRMTVAEAFSRFAAIDLLATLQSGGPDRERFAAAAGAAGIRLADDDTWSDIFSRVLVERIEPHLGCSAPTILYEYPAPEAALARPASDPRVAQRFELYACGIELANGYGELTDPAEQRRRFDAAMRE
ncbi:MAG TPA: EF-P lysine aminoacylase EpmA, partial [Xanthobacteraceae bacterium]|nr:EF-P lysine aminoacylase EpmA [Xanthobacteraceae bacterium]